jgi:RNA polymerase subunit RPABC4/transcription elongation factor Spt4
MALTPEVRARLRAQRGDAHTSRRPSEHRGSAAPATRTCPYCKEEIHEDAVSCKHCGKTTLSARQWWRGCLLLVVTSACLGVGWKLGCEPDCKRREQECRAKFATARAKIEALPGYPSRLVVKPINDVVGDWPHCEDTSCDAGPCASCWWKVGDRCSPSIFATVERWGNPLEVRAGSQVYEIHFNEP